MKNLSVLLSSVLGMGAKRIMLLAAVIAMTIGLMAISLMLLNKPVRETLYSGLDSEDVNRIGAVLSEIGIKFDVNEAGNAVLVDYGKTAQARMILAEKGLPKSGKSGYELFDQMGSLGLTSFMQQITKTRALEGELVRTIQQLEGIKSARVHLAIKDEGTFRNKDDQPSASVVIRSLGKPTEATAMAIRQIVASAVPGLHLDHVTVMTTDGTMLTTSNSGDNAEPDRKLELETKISKETEDRIERTLAPFAGMNNIRVSVAAALDMDHRQTTETNYDPESKVERSTKTIKSIDQSSDNNASPTVSADQNIPKDIQPTSPTDTSSKKKENKEETVNYEVNSRQTATVANGYHIERLSVAVVINKQALLKAQGSSPDEAKIDAQIKELEQLIKSSAGFDEKRGDMIRVSAMEFTPEDATLEPLAGPGIMEILKGNFGTIFNALSLLLALVLVTMLGLRPAIKMLVESKPLPALQADSGLQSAPLGLDFASGVNTSNVIRNDPTGARDKLNKVVGIDVDRAAQVLKQWLDQPTKESA